MLALNADRLLPYPHVLDLRWMQQGLHDHAILLSFLLQSRQLFLGCLRCADVEFHSYIFEPDGHGL